MNDKIKELIEKLKEVDGLSYNQSIDWFMTNPEKMRGDRASEGSEHATSLLTGSVSEHFDSKKFKKQYGRGFNEREKYLEPIMKELIAFGSEAVEPLINVLNNHESWSCIFAAHALGEIKDERAIKPLISAAETDGADFLDEESMFALTKIGKKAIPQLIDAVSYRIDNPEKDGFGEELIWNFTLGALSEIQDNRVVNFLISLAERKEFIKYSNNAVTLALNMGDQHDIRLIPYLKKIIEMHKDNDYVVREAEDSICVIEENCNPEYLDLKKKLNSVQSSKEILELGLNYEKIDLGLARLCYEKLLEINEKDYHALFCLAHLDRKEGFRSALFYLEEAIKEAKKQNASLEVLKLMKEEKLRILERSEKQMEEDIEGEADNFWEEGYFAETLSPQDMKERIRTLHKKHDEDMNFNCKICNKKISAHNKDWHNGMCDDCFDKEYYPKKQTIKE